VTAAIHVCPEAEIAPVLRQSQAGWAVSLLSSPEPVPSLSAIAVDRRLHLNLSDITTAQPGHVLAAEAHVAMLLAFLHRWDRQTALLIHCYAGVSRSPAAAFIALCAFDPDTAEIEHARRLRAASPTATPNPHLVALGDRLLARNGRMRAAVAAIGRGCECFEGVPFTLAIEPRRVDDLGSLPA
jgi:predicted protein tyrosine phosphatase